MSGTEKDIENALRAHIEAMGGKVGDITVTRGEPLAKVEPLTKLEPAPPVSVSHEPMISLDEVQLRPGRTEAELRETLEATGYEVSIANVKPALTIQGNGAETPGTTKKSPDGREF